MTPQAPAGGARRRTAQGEAGLLNTTGCRCSANGKLIEPGLIQPTFVTHIPKELCPLAKVTIGDDSTIDVFELCINGQEIAPAYSEQNDPGVQRKMLEIQAGAETQKIDEDFLLALEHGMPPAGGLGIGIDRLVILLTGAANIRDVILFPTLAPEAQA